MRPRRRGEAGLTLVELMVVVAMIGILAGIAIPTFSNVMPKVRLSNATQTLANEIAMSRMAAIAKSTVYSVSFNVADNSYALNQFTDDPTTSAIDYAWRQNSTTNLGASVVFGTLLYEDLVVVPTAGSPPTSTLQLNANGTTNVPFVRRSMRIELQSPDGTLRKRVVAATSGRIFSQRWTGGDPNNDANWIEE